MNSLTSSTPWRSDLLRKVAARLRPKPPENVWQWAARNVVFPKSYPTAKDGRYDPDWLPFWKQCQENVTNRDIREQVILKCSQSGATQNVAQNAIGYTVARHPVPLLYAGAQQEMTEDFWEERIKPGLLCSAECRAKYRRARVRGMAIHFDDMVMAATWSTSLAGLKMRALGLAIADELSIWPLDSLDKLRKRLETYPFSHLLIISTPDAKSGRPSDKDPIFIEFKQSSQAYWFMRDPKTKRPFRFEMGFKLDDGRESPHGLKWSDKAKRDDGTWDEAMVRKTAHYVTPDGTKIWGADKNDLVRAGDWIHTVPHSRLGYHLNAFYLSRVDFGDVAWAFLDAQSKGTAALRIFILEWLVEEWKDKGAAIGEHQLTRKEGSYIKGQRFAEVEPYKTFYIGKTTTVFTTADVQKFDIRWINREHVMGGDSGLIGRGSVLTFQEVDELAKKSSRVLIDCGYAQRAFDVYEACIKFKFIPTKGSDSRLTMPFVQTTFNPFEGTRRQRDGEQLGMIVFDANWFKLLTMDKILGISPCAWWVYKNIERDYVREVISEELVDGKWVLKRGHPDNHFWDCEVLQQVAAQAFGFNSKLADL